MGGGERDYVGLEDTAIDDQIGLLDGADGDL